MSITRVLEGRVGIVTGAGSGIGRACALAFAAQGARVAVADGNRSRGEETVDLIARAEGEALFCHVDVTDPRQVEGMVRQTVDAFGRVDWAHNNAGISGEVATTDECTEANWDQTMAVNLKGVWLCMKYEIRHMLQQGSGAIVNTAAGAGLVGLAGLPAYVASKHGVIGLTKSAALELARSNIRVNAVCPGTTGTPMIDDLTAVNPDAIRNILRTIPMGRIADPREIAAAVVWLCSDSSAFVTGHALVVDGGTLAQ